MRTAAPLSQFGRRAAEAAILTAFSVGVYAAVVVGGGAALGTGGKPNVALAVVATAIIAVAFVGVRDAAGRVAARLAYGGGRDPYEVLAAAARQASGILTSDEALFRMAEVIGRGTGARRAEVWLRVEDRLRLAASWPTHDEVGREQPLPVHGTPHFVEASRAVPVVHHEETLGAIAVHVEEDRRLGEIEESLLEGLASQAGLALHNAALTAELRRRVARTEQQASALAKSRRRILAAQDDERRRLQRNIHDGVQQHLVALVVKLRLAKRVMATSPEHAHALLAAVRDDLDQALSSLRELARGVHPPVLTDRGMAAAIESHGTRLPIRLRMEDRTHGRRFDPRVEATVYFCCTESLRHVASAATVRLEEVAGDVVFAVIHDGTADEEALAHLEDRAASFDGSVQVEPGVLWGRIPAMVRDECT